MLVDPVTKKNISLSDRRFSELLKEGFLYIENEEGFGTFARKGLRGELPIFSREKSTSFKYYSEEQIESRKKRGYIFVNSGKKSYFCKNRHEKFVSPKKLSVPKFKPVEIVLTKKSEISPLVDNSLITPEELTDLLNDDDFLLRVYDSICRLIEWKISTYDSKIASCNNDEIREVYVKIRNSLLIIKNGRTKAIDASIVDNSEVRELDISPLSLNRLRSDLNDAINNPEKGIQSLIGESRQQVRNFLATQIYVLKNGIQSYKSSYLNMILFGGAGSGKTKLARVIAHVMTKAKILTIGNVVELSRSGFISGFVCQTGQKTIDLLLKNLESVVVLDEAHNLYKPDSPQDYGADTITELIKMLESHVGLGCFVAAGYKQPMIDRFLGADEGMDRRFPTKIELPNYTSMDLFHILETFLIEKFDRQILSETEQNYIYSIVDKLYQSDPSIFNHQAGDMQNLAAIISRRILNDFRLKWNYEEDELAESNRQILHISLTEFCSSKGYEIKLN